jgi:hypothetical protein
MISQEIMQATHQQRAREALAALREAEAMAATERKSRPRRLALPRIRGFPRPSINSGRSRVAPAP